MTENDSLHDLIIRIGSGDRSAFDALYMKMRDPLCKKVFWKYSPTLSEGDAEDAVQNAFIKIQRYASGYHGYHNEASAHQWINTIVFSEASKMVKVISRLSTALDDPDGPDSNSTNNYAVPERSSKNSDLYWKGNRFVEEDTEKKINIDKILATIQQSLTVEEIKLLVLRFVHGYTFEQIGHEIGRTKVRAKQIIDALVVRIRQLAGVDLTQI